MLYLITPQDGGKINVLVITCQMEEHMVVTCHHFFIHFLFDYLKTCLSVIFEALKYTPMDLTHTNTHTVNVVRVLCDCGLDVSEKCLEHELLFNMIP